MPNNGQPNFDEEFDEAVAEWRDEHRLREDDAVILLVELFRIHQRHWDELRRRELPVLEPLRGDLRRLGESNRACQQQIAALVEQLSNLPPLPKAPTVTRTAAWLAALAGSLAGYLLGKAWL